MPNRGQDQAFAELAKGDPQIVVTAEDLESGDQFANLPAGGSRAVDEHLAGGQGLLSENRFAHLMLAPAGLWLLLIFAVPLGIMVAVSLGETDPVYRRSTDGTRPTTPTSSIPCSRRCCCARWATRWRPSSSAC